MMNDTSVTNHTGAAVPLVTPATHPEPITRKKKTVHDMKNGRKGTHRSFLDIQIKAINAVCEFMGPSFWEYKKGTRKRYNQRAELLEYVQKACCFEVTYRPLMRWIEYYQQYGEVPEQTKRNRKKRKTIGDLRGTGNRKFNPEDQAILYSIIKEHPQLYLDEIQYELELQTGKTWHPSTIWRKIHSLGYSLKVAVFRAKQQSKEEQAAYHCRIVERLQHPRQLLFIDETARGANASRRRRAYSPRGVTPIVDAPMVREFDKRYTLIAAFNWDGFVVDACDIVEREQGSNDAKDEGFI